jgi:hypothetical protein
VDVDLNDRLLGLGGAGGGEGGEQRQDRAHGNLHVIRGRHAPWLLLFATDNYTKKEQKIN